MANILDLVGETFTPVRLSNNLWTTREHDSLRIWTASNSFYWYAKGIGGDAYTWLTKVNDYEPEFAKELASDYGVEDNKFLRKPKTSQQYEIYQIVGKPIYHPYFAERNINEETAKHFRLEFDTQLNRVIIPIYRETVKVGALSRRVNAQNKKERYKLTLFVKDKPALWPESINEIPLVFEGCWSAMRFWQVLHEKYPEYSYHAILGTYPSRKLRELFNGLQPIFILDYDDAGQKVTEHLDKMKLNYRFFIPSIYPDELTDKQIFNLIRKIRK